MPRPRVPDRGWTKWANRGAAALLDQALFGGAQFAANIMLARWFNFTDYGRFAVIYALVVFVNALHVAFVAEPCVVFWAKHGTRKADFLADMLALNGLFSLGVFAVGLLPAAGLLMFGFVGFDEIALALLLPLALPLFWLFRQIAYAEMHPWRATAQSAAYGGGLLLGLMLLKSYDLLSVASVLGAMSLAAIGPVLAALWAYRPRMEVRRDAQSTDALSECWRYGRWSAPSGVAMWFATNVYILVMPLVTTLGDSGRVKAFMNILLPFQQILLGLSLVALPALSRAVTEGRRKSADALSVWFLIAAVGGASIFALLLLAGGSQIYRIVYGARYAGDAHLVAYGLALPVIWAVIATGRTVLRARKAPKAIFIAYAGALASIGLVAIPLGALNGPEGALLGMTAIHGTVAAILLWQMARGKTAP